MPLVINNEHATQDVFLLVDAVFTCEKCGAMVEADIENDNNDGKLYLHTLIHYIIRKNASNKLSLEVTGNISVKCPHCSEVNSNVEIHKTLAPRREKSDDCPVCGDGIGEIIGWCSECAPSKDTAGGREGIVSLPLNIDI